MYYTRNPHELGAVWHVDGAIRGSAKSMGWAHGSPILAASNVGGGERPMDPKRGLPCTARTEKGHDAPLEGRMRGGQMLFR